MEKIGKRRISNGDLALKTVKCANCGGKGIFRVIYEDMWGKLKVTLCEECAKKEYGELKL